MTTVTVDVNDKTINEALRKELKRLESQTKRLKESNDKLKHEIREQRFKIEEAQRIVTAASLIADEFREEWEDRDDD